MKKSKESLEKAYEPKKHEDDIYKKWESSGFFNPDKLPGKRKNPFTISMPPPNATGTLHLGHASMLAIQDILIRYNRLQGKKTLWVPGTDHASIATQNRVEKLIAEDGKTRHDLGRTQFLQEVEDFVEDSRDTIRNQIRKMGSSCDWTREAYTLSPTLTKVVQETFITMHNDGIIYRGDRIVNWCPRCASTLANDEVKHKTTKGNYYYFKYGPITIGTARPETKFLDKTIIVHPEDKRYKDLVGKTLTIPWMNGDIVAHVIADTAADMEEGTGAMTITPAHSFIDFELAQKHNLPIVQIINEKGELTGHAGEFAGQNANQAREKIVKKMKREGLVEKIDTEYEHNLSVCYLCDTPVEPLISKQWFISVDTKAVEWKGKKQSLKEIALDVVKSNDISIVPNRFNKTYFHWIENLHDWCISRQIWFGHRIPVWYNEKEETEISISKPTKEGTWKQDPDTLDTWFSSGQWTFSTLLESPKDNETLTQWKKRSKDVKTFHPTNVLETGYDILFFWIARMILMTTYGMKEIPFETVYLHGMVRDKQGRKMSKSLGNGIDPLDMIKKYGTDALRLSLIVGATPGNDSRLYEEKIAGYRNFVNKLWNISRFIITSVQKPKIITKTPKPTTLSDEWILSQLHFTIEKVTNHLEAFELSAAAETLREFTWNELADWYLEIAKIEKDPSHSPPVGGSDGAGKDDILLYILTSLLKLWHPFTPFVTERIWNELSGSTKNEDLLIVESWPENKKHKPVTDFKTIQNIIIAIRTARAELQVEASNIIDAVITAKPAQQKLITKNQNLFEKLARVTLSNKDYPQKGHVIQESGVTITLHVPVNKEKTKKEIEKLEKYIKALKNKLSNASFIDNAPQSIVQKEQEKLAEAENALQKLKALS